jgi:hypothetical protein
LIAVAALTALLFLAITPGLLHPGLSDTQLDGVSDAEKRIALQQAQAKLQEDARSTLLQSLGGLVLIAGAVATWRQLQINRHGQITERITRAVDQIGSANVDVRVGGVYALKRVAKNSAEDRSAITTILATYVQAHALRTPDAPESADFGLVAAERGVLWLRYRAPDVQAALDVLTSRTPADDEPPIFLSHTDLKNARMSGGTWRQLICRHSDLRGVRLRNAQMDSADLTDTDLRGAALDGARLVDAVLEGANLEDADLRGADVRGADFTGARLDGADLAGIRADARTRWPAGLDPVPAQRPQPRT